MVEEGAAGGDPRGQAGPDAVRWGILSTANIGRAAVIPAIHASSNGAAVAVASRSVRRARKFARANGIAASFGDYETMLAEPAIDAVYIPLPNSLHHEWTLKCVEAGKHVLCEKPLALDAAQCLEMEAAARVNGVKLMEAFMYRFHPRTERVIELARSGALGRVGMIRSAFTFKLRRPHVVLGRPSNIRLDPDLGGGALMDVGCYCVNVSRTIAGEEPVAVRAVMEPASTGVDARLVGTLEFADGLYAQLDCALTMERREVYEVAGTDAWLEVPRSFLPGTDDMPIYEHRGRGEVREHEIAGADEYRLMVEHFGECVRTDSEPRYPAREAAANLRVIEALYTSARNGGTPVEVPRGPS